MIDPTLAETTKVPKVFLHMEDYPGSVYAIAWRQRVEALNLNVRIENAETLDEVLDKLIALSNPSTPRYAGLIIDAGFDDGVNKAFEFTLRNGEKKNTQIEISKFDRNSQVRGILLITMLLQAGYYHCQLPMIILTNAAEHVILTAKNKLEALLKQNGVQNELNQCGKSDPQPIVDWIRNIIQQ